MAVIRPEEPEQKNKVARAWYAFGWAAIIFGIMLHSYSVPLYWTDFVFGAGIFCFWFAVRKQRKAIENQFGSPTPVDREYYLLKIFKQEEPLYLVLIIAILALAIVNLPFMYNYFRLRNTLRSLIFLVILVCFVWLLVLLVRRRFGRASETTAREKEAFSQIHEGAQRNRKNRQTKKAQKTARKKK